MKRWEMDKVGRDRLRLETVPVPVPQVGEVLVKVGAASLNFRDKLIIEGSMPVIRDFPFTPGSDMAGTVVAIGDGVDRVAAGDRVISTFAPGWIDGAPLGDARTPPYRTLGGYYPGVLAEYIVVPQDWLARAPATLDDAEASTLPCAGLTAWFALVERGGLHAGQTVVVEGTGGVALFGLQLARAHGAEAIVVSGNAEKREKARQLGASHVLERAGWVEAVLDITGGQGADHVLELVGGAHLAQAVAAAAVGGQVYQIGVLEGFEVSAPVAPLMLKTLTVHGIAVGHRRALEAFVSAVDHTNLKPVIDQRYRLDDLADALDHLERGAFGKVVIDVGGR
jgi:NADPH:quinone reductase-like Zn-dependent oxidoreductase